MADKRITDLPELIQADSGDFIPIVDSSMNVTKRVAAEKVLPNVSVPPSALAGLVGNLEVQAGVAVCSASPSGAVTRVDFPEEFSSPPIVTVSYSSAYAGDLRVGIPGTGDIDTEGFSVHVVRGNTTNTFVTWIAVAGRD